MLSEDLIWESYMIGVNRDGIPNSVVSDSAASKKSVVEIALSLLESIGTSTKDLWRVSNHVPPAGNVEFDGMDITGAFNL